MAIETGIQPSEFLAVPELIRAVEWAIHRRSVEAGKRDALNKAGGR